MKVKKLVLAALFAALAYCATLIIHIPSPIGGYLNLGDCIVLKTKQDKRKKRVKRKIEGDNWCVCFEMGRNRVGFRTVASDLQKRMSPSSSDAPFQCTEMGDVASCV